YYAMWKMDKVLNIGFSSPTSSPEMARALDYATSRGLSPVASVGNGGSASLVYPAALDNVMGVASTSTDDVRSTFSNYGATVWVAAPGEGVITTYPWSSYAAGWGTSFSTPFVSGAAALLVGMEASADYSHVSRVVSFANPLTSDLGYGRLDLYQAILAGYALWPGAPPSSVPQTCPFYVEGAEPGDTLAVRIEKLEPARDYAVSVASPGFGALKGTDKTAMLGPDLPEAVWFYVVDRAKGVARTRSQDGKLAWEVPLAPFLGCLGVAPAYGEARSTVVPDNFGGNMDCPEVRAGNTVYLGVRVPGALLSFGDGHFAMGEGEIIGTAIEGAMNVELTVDLIKKRATPWPRIENAQWMMSVGASRPLEDAARIAFKDMVAWVREKTGLSEMDAYEFVSQTARAPIVQIVDPQYTGWVKIEKSRLPTASR